MKRNFLEELYCRINKPWNSAFFGYFILIVIVFAGSGVAFSVYDVYNSPADDGINVARNLATYFIAILASSVIDLNLSWEIENRVSMLVYSFLIFVLGFVLVLFIYFLKSDYAFIPALGGCFLSWLVWILANADNDKLSDENFFNNMRGKDKHGKTWGK
jgi:hypothetical protein